MRLFPLALLVVALAAAQTPILPGRTPLLDAHNCYPYEGRWEDRIDRALSTGFPIAIEQDLAWYTDPKTGAHRSILAHGEPFTGTEPVLREYFFPRVLPALEQARRLGRRNEWPLIILHFDFKDDEPEHIRAVWKLLGENETWITTAKKTANPSEIAPLDLKPLLVLTEESDVQEKIFFGEVPVGGKLRVFGSAKVNRSFLEGLTKEQKIAALARVPPEQLVSKPPTNYRRWWNNSWYVVERGGAPGAGAWTEEDNARLKALVDYAHGLKYWIRFYTLDGFAPAQDRGWGKDYNFGSRDSVQKRWRAAIEAGADLIATDQYEDLREFLESLKPVPR
jgi:hypothetical protein